MAEVFINGSMGRLEGRLELNTQSKAPFALILPPNPLQGGTMNNRVSYAIFQAFVNMGFSALRFNFRGVANSQGELDGTGAGELIDTITVLDWIQTLPINITSTWIAGYGFGTWVAAQVLMRRPELNGFVFVSPPIHSFPFDFLAPCPTSGLIIHPEKDVYDSTESVGLLAEKLDSYPGIKVDYQIIPEADYLYTNKLKPLYDCVLKEVPELQKVQPQKLGRKKAVFLPNDDYE